jgi:hypothetical protein
LGGGVVFVGESAEDLIPVDLVLIDDQRGAAERRRAARVSADIGDPPRAAGPIEKNARAPRA